MCGFIAQLVEHRSAIAVTGSNPVEALIFFRLLLSSCFNWKIYCDDHFQSEVCSSTQRLIRSALISGQAAKSVSSPLGWKARLPQGDLQYLIRRFIFINLVHAMT